MDIYKILEERRSIRKYEPEPVPIDKLKHILEAARIAPSWKNLQCWRFIIVRDHELKKQLAESMPTTNPARSAVGKTAPVVIVLCAEPSESGLHDGKDYYMLDAGLAMQQLMLAAHAEGLGTCWVGLFDEEKVKKVCSIPEDYRVVAMSPLGYPAVKPSVRPRKELTEIIFAEKWDQQFELD
ncbi:MAG: nitroreductase family protein [Bacillota bacterium]|nr:nitroreductase family protein [Bacillota bacterium]